MAVTKKTATVTEPQEKYVPGAPKKPYKKAKFTAKIARMWHPDQKIYIDTEPVILEVDSWTEVQEAEGLLIRHTD